MLIESTYSHVYELYVNPVYMYRWKRVAVGGLTGLDLIQNHDMGLYGHYTNAIRWLVGGC